MKKIVSTVYKNTTIQFLNELVEFENGKAEVKDKTWEYIKNGGFSGIALEEEANTLEKEKSESEKDTDEALKVLKEEYEFEIARLNGIIKDKNKKIEQLEQSIDVWKKRLKDCLTVVSRKKLWKNRLKKKPAQQKKKLLL